VHLYKVVFDPFQVRLPKSLSNSLRPDSWILQSSRKTLAFFFLSGGPTMAMDLGASNTDTAGMKKL
jgi:hypothetical protein